MLAGQYELAHNDAKEAKIQFVAARNSLDAGGNTIERNAALIHVAVGMAGLTGNKPDVEAGRRLDWEKDKINAEMRSTLTKLPLVSGEDFRDMRTFAFRRLARALNDSGKAGAVAALANAACPEDDRAEVLAAIGLELLSVGQRDEAEKLAKLASAGLRVEQAPSLIALWLAIASPDAASEKKKAGSDGAAKIAKPPDGKGLLSPLAQIGYAEGWARQGNLEKARALAARSGKPEERLRAMAAVAGVAVDVHKSDVTDLDNCAKLIETELKNARIAPWLLLRLVELSNRADKPELAEKFAGAILDPGAKAWAKYEILRDRLERKGNEPGDWKAAEEVGSPERMAHWLAVAALAQHNAEVASPSNVMSEIKNWDDARKPFGYAGVALAERQ